MGFPQPRPRSPSKQTDLVTLANDAWQQDLFVSQQRMTPPI